MNKTHCQSDQIQSQNQPFLSVQSSPQEKEEIVLAKTSQQPIQFQNIQSQQQQAPFSQNQAQKQVQPNQRQSGGSFHQMVYQQPNQQVIPVPRIVQYQGIIPHQQQQQFQQQQPQPFNLPSQNQQFIQPFIPTQSSNPVQPNQQVSPYSQIQNFTSPIKDIQNQALFQQQIAQNQNVETIKKQQNYGGPNNINLSFQQQIQQQIQQQQQKQQAPVFSSIYEDIEKYKELNKQRLIGANKQSVAETNNMDTDFSMIERFENEVNNFSNGQQQNQNANFNRVKEDNNRKPKPIFSDNRENLENTFSKNNSENKNQRSMSHYERDSNSSKKKQIFSTSTQQQQEIPQQNLNPLESKILILKKEIEENKITSEKNFQHQKEIIIRLNQQNKDLKEELKDLQNSDVFSGEYVQSLKQQYDQLKEKFEEQVQNNEIQTQEISLLRDRESQLQNRIDLQDLQIQEFESTINEQKAQIEKLKYNLGAQQKLLKEEGRISSQLEQRQQEGNNTFFRRNIGNIDIKQQNVLQPAIRHENVKQESKQGLDELEKQNQELKKQNLLLQQKMKEIAQIKQSQNSNKQEQEPKQQNQDNQTFQFTDQRIKNNYFNGMK